MSCNKFTYKGQIYTEEGINALYQQGEFNHLLSTSFAQAEGETLIDRIVAEGEKWVEKPEVTEDGIEDVWKYTDGETELMRLTHDYHSIVNKWRRRPWQSAKRNFAVVEADQLWANKDKEATIFFPELGGKSLNYVDFVAELMLRRNKQITRGTVGHAILQSHIETDPTKLAEVRKKIISDLNAVGMQSWEMSWVDANWQEILRKTGTNIFDGDAEAKDKIRAEVRLASKVWGTATTADILIERADGTYILSDFKFGRTLDTYVSKQLWKFGNQSGRNIFQTSRDRAKLEVMLRAMIAVTENPEMKFHDLQVIWVPSEDKLDYNDPHKHVEITQFLGLIEDNLIEEYNNSTDKENTIYGKLKKLPHFKTIFNPSTYHAGYSSDNLKEMNKSARNVDQQMAHLQDQLRAAVQFELDPHIRETEQKVSKIRESERIMQQILDLSDSPELELKGWNKDIGWLSLYLGSNRDINNPYIQFYNKMLEKQKRKARERYTKTWTTYRALLEPVKNHYYERTGEIKPITESFQPFEGLLSNIDPIKFWEWAFKVKDEEGAVHELITTEEDWIEASQKWEYLRDPAMREHYKKLLNFMQDEMSQFFVDEKSTYGTSLANRIATYKFVGGREIAITNMQLHTQPHPSKPRTSFTYSRGFFPKMPKTKDEYGPWLGRLFNAKWRDELWYRMFTWRNEDQYFQEFNEDEMIPFRYLGSPVIDQQQNYSLNLEASFLDFMKYTTMKEELEDVYALGMGLRHYLLAKKNPGVKYPKNVIDYLEIMLEMQIRGRRQRSFEGGLFSRDPGITRITKTKNNGEKVTTYTVNWIKVLRLLKSSTSSTVMGLKFFQGTANGVFTGLYTVKESFKDEIIRSKLGKFIGIDGNQVAFTTKQLGEGFNEWRKMVGDHMQGKLYENKLWLLMKELGYETDNYDFFNNEDSLFTTRSQITNGTFMYMFYTLPEEAITATILAAQLKSMKIKSGPKAGTTLWDMYDTQTVVGPSGATTKQLVWKDDYVRGYKEIKSPTGEPVFVELKGIDENEANRLKYIYQRMHGGYRGDERTMGEYFIFGEMLLQFKRYLPTILRNTLGSKGISHSYGYYKPKEGPDGKPLLQNGKEVVEWHNRIVEGRWRTIGGLLLNALAVKSSNLKNSDSKFAKIFNSLGIESMETYRWKDLDEGQKEFVADAMATGLMLLGLAATYFLIFGGADEDDPLAKLSQRVIGNFSQQWNLMEPARDIALNGAPTSWKVNYNRADALAEMFWATMMIPIDEERAFTQTGTLHGFNQFLKYTPYVSAWQDAVRYLTGTKDPTEWTFERILNK